MASTLVGGSIFWPYQGEARMLDLPWSYGNRRSARQLPMPIVELVLVASSPDTKVRKQEPADAPCRAADAPPGSRTSRAISSAVLCFKTVAREEQICAESSVVVPGLCTIAQR